MRRLGYFDGPESSHWRPSNFGSWWMASERSTDWYQWMFDMRRKMHLDMVAWVECLAETSAVTSVADVGCGRAIGYPELLPDKRYIGVDLSQNNIDWCTKQLQGPNLEFHCIDIMEQDLPEKADLVFSSGTIDNVYDMDAYLEALVRNSNKWIYLTCYRGWFPELPEHLYSWNGEHGCFYNDLSPSRARRVLSDLGCSSIAIEPVRTQSDRQDILFETRIVARCD